MRLLAASLLLLGACMRPPILLDPYAFQEHNTHINYPPGHVIETIEVPGPDGNPVALRGVYIPGDPGAGIVVQFQETSISAASDHLGYETYAESMHDLGLHFLVIDYRGVGLSEGGRNGDLLSADGHRIVRHALSKVGGDKRKLVLRGTSLGTIVIAQLIDEGIRPAGAVMLLPVRSASAARRYAQEFYTPVEVLAADLLMRPISESDPLDLMSRAPLPLLVFSPAGDPLIHLEDRRQLLDYQSRGSIAVFEPNGQNPWIELWLGEQGMTAHETGCMQAHGPIDLAELDWLEKLNMLHPARERRLEEWRSQWPREVRAALDQDPAAQAGLAELAGFIVRVPPEWAAAAAIQGWEPRLAAQLFRHARDIGGHWRGAPWSELLASFDLSDPQGDLPLRLVERNLFTVPCPPEDPARLVRLQACVDAVFGTHKPDREERILRAHAAEDLQWVHSLGVDEGSARRLYTRILLKAARMLPDRVVPCGERGYRLEVLLEGQWVPFEDALTRSAAPLPARSPKRE